MKKFMLTAAGIASVALAGSAAADVTVDFDVQGPGGSSYSFDAGGYLGSPTTVQIDLNFTNSGGWTWAGDLLIAFVDSAGNGVEFGGYNLSYGYSSIGDFGSSWDTSSSGAFSATIDLSGSGLSNVVTVLMADGYSNGSSTDNWNGTMTIGGVDVPAPGAVALLGLAGLAGRRRRR